VLGIFEIYTREEFERVLTEAGPIVGMPSFNLATTAVHAPHPNTSSNHDSPGLVGPHAAVRAVPQ